VFIDFMQFCFEFGEAFWCCGKAANVKIIFATGLKKTHVPLLNPLQVLNIQKMPINLFPRETENK